MLASEGTCGLSSGGRSAMCGGEDLACIAGKIGMKGAGDGLKQKIPYFTGLAEVERLLGDFPPGLG